MQAEGVRLRFMLDGQSRIFEIYWLLLGQRLASANFITTPQGLSAIGAAWNLLRNSLKAEQGISPTPCQTNLSEQQILGLYQHALELEEAGSSDEAINQFECVLQAIEKDLVKPGYQQTAVLLLNGVSLINIAKCAIERGNIKEAEALY